MTMPTTPDGYIRVTTGTIQAEDKFWNWNERRFDDACWLKGQTPGGTGDRYIIRKVLKSKLIKPKRTLTWSKKLAALAVNKEK